MVSQAATEDQAGAAGRRPITAAAPPGSLVSPAGAIQEATESAAPRFVGMLAVILPAALLIQALVNLAQYRQPAVPVVVWAGMLATAAWLVPRAGSAGLSATEATAAVAVAVVAVTAIGLDRRAPVVTPAVDWTVLGTIWLLALVALSRPARMWVPGAALVLIVHAAFVLRLLGLSPPGLARAAAGAYSMIVALAVFAALRPTLRMHAEIAARRAEMASRSAAERAAVDAIREDRRGRLAVLEVEALPLLRGIADGTLDPADSAVRQECAEHAAALRRVLVERPGQAGGVLAELEPALGAARARGVLVEVQVVGDPGPPTRDVAQATLAAVDLVLRTLPPQPVTLTVLASADEAELYLTFERAPHGMPGLAGLDGTIPASAQWQATMDAGEAGAGCLEIRWRRSPALGALA
jgi:hypothetical protein